jgi:excisionase family DNA binding protein
MQNKLISIGKAAQRLGVSIDTLRRWDASGRLKATRIGPHSHRYYLQSDLDQFLEKVDAIGRNWAENNLASEPQSDYYCATRDVFQARLETFQSKLLDSLPVEKASLITAVAGEIGNNSFDHNLGNWPDTPGVFFAYTLRDRKAVLADRGLGILTTLERVRPNLVSAKDALKVAFTETVSGRYPEARGNGLKFVRSIIIKYPLTLYFQTGNAFLYLKESEKDINIQELKIPLRGCFAIIDFEDLI